MKLLTLSIVIIIYYKLERVKQGLRIITQRWERRYYGKAIINEAFLYSEEISIKSTAFLKGTVNIEGPTLAVRRILTRLTVSLTWSVPMM